MHAHSHAMGHSGGVNHSGSVRGSEAGFAKKEAGREEHRQQKIRAESGMCFEGRYISARWGHWGGRRPAHGSGMRAQALGLRAAEPQHFLVFG